MNIDGFGVNGNVIENRFFVRRLFSDRLLYMIFNTLNGSVTKFIENSNDKHEINKLLQRNLSHIHN